jgi:hypothetical protein
VHNTNAECCLAVHLEEDIGAVLESLIADNEMHICKFDAPRYFCTILSAKVKKIIFCKERKYIVCCTKFTL